MGDAPPQLGLEAARRDATAFRVKAVTWNARSLLLACPRLRAKTLEFVAKLLRKFDAVFLQEVKGDIHVLRRHIRQLAPGTRVLGTSLGEAVGGIAVLMKEQWLQKARVDWRALVPGRVGQVTVHRPAGRLKFIVVHNAELDDAAAQRATRAAHEALDLVAGAPFEERVVLLGDFNLHVDSSRRCGW